MISWRHRAIAFVTTLALVSGCGSGSKVLRGEVTLEGEKVGPGTISFLPDGPTESRKSAAAILDGKYEVAPEHQPSAGTFKVEISWPKETGKMVPGIDPGIMVPERAELIPKKYNTETTLTVEIKSGENVLDFHLKRK